MAIPMPFAWLKERVKTVLQNGGISIYREDCNIEQMDRNYSTLAQMFPDRAGIVENKCVQGHYDHWAYVNEIEGVELLDSLCIRADTVSILNRYVTPWPFILSTTAMPI